MSSYMESLDRKEMIRKARKRMQHFSDLYRLLGAGYQIHSIMYGNDIQSNGYNNHSQKILKQIEKKDERYAEIEEVLSAIERLDDDEAECLFLKHIVFTNTNDISSMLGKSRSSTYEIINEAYFKIAIIMKLK